MRRLILLAFAALAGCVPPPSRPAPYAGPAYQLVDVEKLATQSPGAFELPPLELRRACRAGQKVKIILEVPPGAPSRGYTGERPWMLLKEVRPGPRYVGQFNNELVVFSDLDPELPVEFGPEHIVEIWKE
jgi:hypothetical protein